MEVTQKEQKRAERLLQSRHIEPQHIKSFSFMQRYPQTSSQEQPSPAVKYGPGILTLHMKEGKDKVVCLPPFRHPSSTIRYLVSQGVPFDNYTPRKRTAAELPAATYRRPSLYMLWFFALFLAFLILGYHSVSGEVWWGFIPAAIFFTLSLFFLNMLMTRFCYLTLEQDALVLHSVGRSVRYPYGRLRKVNFDFARELAFTHVMELLDEDYRYRLFYIGRVPRKKLQEITKRLEQAGVNATCSLNVNKRHFHDRIKAI